MTQMRIVQFYDVLQWVFDHGVDWIISHPMISCYIIMNIHNNSADLVAKVLWHIEHERADSQVIRPSQMYMV